MSSGFGKNKTSAKDSGARQHENTEKPKMIQYLFENVMYPTYINLVRNYLEIIGLALLS